MKGSICCQNLKFVSTDGSRPVCGKRLGAVSDWLVKIQIHVGHGVS